MCEHVSTVLIFMIIILPSLFLACEASPCYAIYNTWLKAKEAYSHRNAEGDESCDACEAHLFKL